MLWLDVVHQLLVLQPDLFEFDERMLLAISRHAFSCRYGNFLADSEYERGRMMIHNRTISIWSLVNSHREDFSNASFKLTDQVLNLPVDLELEYWSGHHDSMNGLNEIGSMHKEVTCCLHDDYLCSPLPMQVAPQLFASCC